MWNTVFHELCRKTFPTGKHIFHRIHGKQNSFFNLYMTSLIREYIVSEDRFSDGASKQSLLFIWINVMEHIPRNNAAIREMRKQCYKKQTMYIPKSGNKQRH